MYLLSHCACQVVIYLKFDFDILLFMLNTCITIIRYFDCSHEAIEFQCIHTCMSLQSFLVWRTKVGIRTGLWWIIGNTEGIRGLGSRGMITSIGTVTQVSIKFRKKKKTNKNMGINIKHNTNNAYENGEKCAHIYGRGGKCDDDDCFYYL